MGEHTGDLGAPLDGFYVPGEGDQIAPITILFEHIRDARNIACLKRCAERIKKLRDLIVDHRIQHVILPDVGRSMAWLARRRWQGYRFDEKGRV